MIGPKPPMPFKGKVWVPGWVMQEAPSTFEEKILSAIKGPLDKPKPVRRKVDWKTKVMSTEYYLEKLSEGNRNEPKPKRQKTEKKKDEQEDEVESETEEEEVIEETSGEENEDEEERLVKLWKWLSPPTQKMTFKGNGLR